MHNFPSKRIFIRKIPLLQDFSSRKHSKIKKTEKRLHNNNPDILINRTFNTNYPKTECDGFYTTSILNTTFRIFIGNWLSFHLDTKVLITTVAATIQNRDNQQQ